MFLNSQDNAILSLQANRGVVQLQSIAGGSIHKRCKAAYTQRRCTEISGKAGNTDPPESRDPQPDPPKYLAPWFRFTYATLNLTFMALMAYSTWSSRPSGEKVFTPRSYSVLHTPRGSATRRPSPPIEHRDRSNRWRNRNQLPRERHLVARG
jgi:hypothetical protein